MSASTRVFGNRTSSMSPISEATCRATDMAESHGMIPISGLPAHVVGHMDDVRIRQESDCGANEALSTGPNVNSRI